MITINLLKRSLADTRHLRRNRRLEGMIGLLALSGVSLIIGLCWVNTEHRIQSLQQEISVKRVQVASQTRFESGVSALLAQKETLMQGLLRLEEIQNLRMQPVSILDTLSQSLDPLDLWLVTMHLGKGRLALDGLAGSHEDILRFSKTLEDQSLFKEVIISETRTESVAEEVLYSFSMNITINMQHVGSTPS